jgi:transcriptional regulator with XRE-family HTH domain
MTTSSATKIFEKLLGPPTFGGFLRAARTRKDFSQKKMAAFLGISTANLCDIEKGRQFVSVDLAAKFAKKCQLPPQLAIQYAIGDQLRKYGLKFEVIVRKKSA